MESLQEQVEELETDRGKLSGELEKVNKRKKKTFEDERELKTTRVRSSSSNLLVKERPRLKSREKPADTSKENSNWLNTNASTMNVKKPLKREK